MKKTLAFVLAFALVLGVGIVAFAANSPAPAPAAGGYTTRTAAQAEEKKIVVYDENGNVIAELKGDEVVNIPIGEADKLSDEDKEIFLAAYEEVKNIQDRVVKYFFWFDIPEKYKTGNFKYVGYPFTCTGKNVGLTVNGNSMEVVNEGASSYVAKLTEFGAVAILCD